MSDRATHYVGIDVAKLALEVNDGGSAAAKRQIANEASAVMDWLRTLPEGTHLVCEATGGYERLLRVCAHACAIPLSAVNPRHARSFAESLGRLEKTDRIDAADLRVYGERMHPAETPMDDPELETLQEWVSLHAHHTAQLVATQNRLEHIHSAAVVKVARAECERTQKLLAKIEGRIAQFLQEDAPQLNDRVQTLCLVQGVGPRTATTLVAFLPELGHCDNGQIAKLAGLAPLCHDSGPRKGQRHIRGGRPAVRRALYLAAVVAAQHNPFLNPFYQRLRTAGKPPKLALVAVARKLLLFLNRLLRPAQLQPA